MIIISFGEPDPQRERLRQIFAFRQEYDLSAGGQGTVMFNRAVQWEYINI